MDETNLHKRVSDLEQQLKAFRTSLNPGVDRFDLAAPLQNPARLLAAKFALLGIALILLAAVYVFGIHFADAYRNASAGKQFGGFVALLLANWTLVIFVGTVLVVGFVQFAFGIDYFESYRNASTTKKLSKFYEDMGDRLMGISEWDAAEEAYKRALEIDHNNTAATFGVAKAQVFDPLPGQKYYTPEVVDARLEHLMSRSPTDYHLFFLKAIRCQHMKQIPEAAGWFRKCIDKNPDFIGGHIGLGILEFCRHRLSEAEMNCANAVERFPGSAVARNDLGACLVLLSKFPEAVVQFTKSYEISPTALTAFTLGEAYWFTSNFKSALYYHQEASDYLQEDRDLQDRYVGGDWTSGFLPLYVGDIETIKTNVEIYTVAQKKALFHFELSIDQALLGNFEAAEQEFAAGLKLQPPQGHRELIQNRLESVKNIVRPMPDATANWLAEHREKLN
jgi:tetratricopeptide (TPR) repeat protein